MCSPTSASHAFAIVPWPDEDAVRFETGNRIAQEYGMKGYWVTKGWMELEHRDSILHETEGKPGFLLQKGDFVRVFMNEEWSEKPPCPLLHDRWVGKIMDIATSGQDGVWYALQWHQRPEDTQSGRQKGQHAREIFASNELDILPSGTVDSKIETRPIDGKDNTESDFLLVSQLRYDYLKGKLLASEKPKQRAKGTQKRKKRSRVADDKDKAAAGRSKRRRQTKSKPHNTGAGADENAGHRSLDFPLQTPEEDVPPRGPQPTREEMWKQLESGANEAAERNNLDETRKPYVLGLGILRERALEEAITCVLKRIPLAKLRETRLWGAHATRVVAVVTQNCAVELWTRPDALVSRNGQVQISLAWEPMAHEVAKQAAGLPWHEKLQATAALLSLLTDEEWDELEPELASATSVGREHRGQESVAVQHSRERISWEG